MSPSSSAYRRRAISKLLPSAKEAFAGDEGPLLAAHPEHYVTGTDSIGARVVENIGPHVADFYMGGRGTEALAWAKDAEELLPESEFPRYAVDLGAGSSALLQQLCRITVDPGDEVLYAWRAFEPYPLVTRLFGARPVQVRLTGDEAHDLDAMALAVTGRTRLVFVCTPNNPTGRALRRDVLEPFLDRLPIDVLIVLAEAYAESTTSPYCADGVELSRDRPNVVTVRTFSKAYGLAGMRIGYAVAHEPVIEALRKAAVPFGVSTVTQSDVFLTAAESWRADTAQIGADRS